MDESAKPVVLRPLQLHDADVFAAWGADSEFCREADWTPGLPYTERRRFHQALIQSPPTQLLRLGATHEGLLVGYIDLHGDEPHRRELGFVIGERRRWGKGLGRLAGAAGLDYGFGHLGLQEIWAEALDANQRSVRILERLGLGETGMGEDSVYMEQRTHYRRFSITAKDWASGQTH